MTILSAQTIRRRFHLDRMSPAYIMEDRFGVIEPFCEPDSERGMSYGLSACGYDIRIGKIGRGGYIFEGDKPGGNKTWKEDSAPNWLVKPGDFVLLASLERFEIPHDIAATVLDKSTLARKGLALQNTILEPGWKGFITLELSNHGHESVRIHVGQPIAQVVFHLLDVPTEMPYVGKYQNAGASPQPAILVPTDGGGVATGRSGTREDLVCPER